MFADVVSILVSQARNALWFKLSTVGIQSTAQLTLTLTPQCSHSCHNCTEGLLSTTHLTPDIARTCKAVGLTKAALAWPMAVLGLGLSLPPSAAPLPAPAVHSSTASPRHADMQNAVGCYYSSQVLWYKTQFNPHQPLQAQTRFKIERIGGFWFLFVCLFYSIHLRSWFYVDYWITWCP